MEGWENINMDIDDFVGFLIAIPFGLFIGFIGYTYLLFGIEAMLYR